LRRLGRLLGAIAVVSFGLQLAGSAEASSQPGPASAAASSGASAGVAFSSTAEADGVRTTVTIPNYIAIPTPVDGGGPTANAVLSSDGQSEAFASFPYPGAFPLSVPGLAAGLTGISLPASYPLYVASNSPSTPSATFDAPSGTATLSAASSGSSSTADASIGAVVNGLPTVGSSATTSISTAADGTVTATASSVTDGLSIAGVVEVGALQSTVTTVLSPAGRLHTTRSLTANGVMVAGIPVSVGPQGLVAVDSFGLPSSLLLQTVNQALKSSGVTIQTIEGESVQGGGTADVLQIVAIDTLPVPGNPVATVTTTVGNAVTTVLEGAPIPAVPAPTSPSAVPSSSGTTTSGSSAQGALGLPSNAGPGASGTGAGTDSATVTPPSGGLAPVVASRPAPQRAAAEAAESVLPIDMRRSLRFFYVVIAVGTAIAVIGGALWRSKGVRATWTP
jgi:hypothetical protein